LLNNNYILIFNNFYGESTMFTPLNPKLTRFVKFVVDLIFWLLVGAGVILVLWIALTPLLLNTTDILISASVPVAIGLGDEPQLGVEVAGSAAKGIQNAFVDQAQGTLRLETTNWHYILTSNLAKLLTAIGLAYTFHLLRAILRSTLNGDPFSPDNCTRVRRVGYLVLLVTLFRAVVEYLAADIILNQLAVTTPPLSTPSPFNAEVILVSLLILVLAQIWSYGLELERDRALTV
jgi:hypothetical protein